MLNLIVRMFVVVALVSGSACLAAGKAGHVVVIVWDGMRPDFITKEHTPMLAQMAQDGASFQNHHAVYCSATEVNGTALATGAYPCHSGIIANHEYLPDVDALNPVDTQNEDVIRKGDQTTGGDYLLRSTLAEILQKAGKRTVIASTKQVGLLQDRRERTNGFSAGVTLFAGKTLPPSALRPIQSLLRNFPPEVDKESADPNEPRDDWTTRALVGSLWSNGLPAFSLLWLTEPDYSQHASGPGSPKSLAALESCDRKLAVVMAAIGKQGARDTTDVFVVSDHGFSSVDRAVNVSKLLQDAGFSAGRKFKSSPGKGDILVAGQGGSVCFYVIGHDLQTTRKLVDFLQRQDFTGVLFTRKPMEGTFTLDQACIDSPHAPDVVLSMRWSADNGETGAPGVIASDSGRVPGQGDHASLSRFDLHNMLVGVGPDLKPGYSDTLPTGNTDLAPTILWLLGVKPKGAMDGRVLSEALTVDAPRLDRPATHRLETSRAGEHFVWNQYLLTSRVNQTLYLDEGNGWATRK